MALSSLLNVNRSFTNSTCTPHLVRLCTSFRRSSRFLVILSMECTATISTPLKSTV
jgi:hypothetical protein